MCGGFERLWFVHCETCNNEFNFDDVKVLRVRNDHTNTRTADFLCSYCNEPTESLITGDLL
jgi:hypothetical protein